MTQSHKTPENWVARVEAMRELGVVRMKFNDGMEIELAPVAPVVEVPEPAPEVAPETRPIMHPNRKRNGRRK